MNESRILIEHQISKQTQTTNKHQIFKNDQISNEIEITNKTKL